MKVGDPLAPDTVVGPRDLRGAAGPHRGAGRSRASSEGAELVAGGDRPDLRARLLRGARRSSPAASPTTRPCSRSSSARWSSWSPSTTRTRRIAIANGTEFGLYDYVFTADTSRGMGVARQLRTGNVGINTAQRNHEAPFGGFKQSGVGRDGGSFGLHAYSELQSIVWPG